MMTPAEMDMYAREIQRDHRNEAAAEARSRRLTPGLFDRLLAALRPRPAATPQSAARPTRTVTLPTTSR
jgi:hypothetical protein